MTWVAAAIEYRPAMRDIYDSRAENAEPKHEYGLKVIRDLRATSPAR
jgi:hypothetical protein